MNSESKVDQIMAAALAEVPSLPLTKDRKDLNGNNAYGLERRTRNAISKVLGLDWKQNHNEAYRIYSGIERPLRKAISDRRNAIREGRA